MGDQLIWQNEMDYSLTSFKLLIIVVLGISTGFLIYKSKKLSWFVLGVYFAAMLYVNIYISFGIYYLFYVNPEVFYLLFDIRF